MHPLTQTLRQAKIPSWQYGCQVEQCVTPHLIGYGNWFEMEIHNPTITSNTISYFSKAVVYPSGAALNASSNTGNVTCQQDNNVLHAVDCPRLCLK